MTTKKITFGKKSSHAEQMAIADALLGKTTGASKGSPAPTEWETKWKGTNPFKKKFALTIMKKL
jgi:hypothetical protein